MRRILAVVIFLAISTHAWADTDNPLEITEVDGSPSTFPYKIKFSNGSVTDNGDGTTSVTTGGGGTPGGSNGNIQYNSANAFAGDPSLNWDASTNTLSISRDVNQVGLAFRISSDTGGLLGSISHDGGAFFNSLQVLNRISVDAGGTGLTSYTKGDLLAATGATTLVQLNVGPAGNLLSTDSTTSTGLAWVSRDTILPAKTKGSLITFTTKPFELLVGSNGNILTADSAQASGLNWTSGKSLLPGTTKGDLIVTDGAGHNQRVAVGANGTLLSADSSQTTGVNWVSDPAYTEVLEDGTVLTQRRKLNFIGTAMTCVDTAGSVRTDCTISAAAVSAPVEGIQYNSASSLSADNALSWFKASKTLVISRDGGAANTSKYALMISSDTGVTQATISHDGGAMFRVVDLKTPLSADSGGTSFGSYAKGDLIVASAATTLNKLTVGANGTVLSADSSTTTGLAWVSPKPYKTYMNFPVQSAKMSADGSCRIDGAIPIWRLLFGDGNNNAGQNVAVWQGRMDDNWGGGPLTAKIDYHMISSDGAHPANKGVKFGVSIWAMTSGDAASMTVESYGTETTKAQDAQSVVSRDDTVTFVLTNLDSLAAGDWFAVKLRRDGSDSITGDAAVTSFALTE